MAISLFLILKTFFEKVDLWFLLVYYNKTSFFLIPTETRVTEFPIEIRVRHLLLTVFQAKKYPILVLNSCFIVKPNSQFKLPGCIQVNLEIVNLGIMHLKFIIINVLFREC